MPTPPTPDLSKAGQNFLTPGQKEILKAHIQDCINKAVPPDPEPEPEPEPEPT